MFGDAQIPSLRHRGGPLAFDTTAATRLLRDASNVTLLKELQADARISRAELARRVGLSAPAVAERLARLTDAGIIIGYSVDLDPAALGYPTTVFVRIRPAPGQLSRVADVISSTPQVVECYRITGEDCFLVKMHVPAVDQLPGVLDQLVIQAGTTTSVVLTTPVPRRPLPLPQE
ncbi:MAG: Lrp/AsnC family transcriptional regulator [Chloroflexota bacterium]|nr:Lrp/AsnC family transcriptional regulator [Chloroflexota bacterium]